MEGRGEEVEENAGGLSSKLKDFLLALAQAVYAARAQKAALPPKMAEALAQLEAQPSPLKEVAVFMKAVAGGEELPVVSEGLPREIGEILEQLGEAVSRAGDLEPVIVDL